MDDDHGAAVGSCWPKRVRELEAERDKLQKFKDFVHAYLDQHGVPADDPDNQHSKEGCRIGARLDRLFHMLEQARKPQASSRPGKMLWYGDEVDKLRAERDAVQAQAAALRESGRDYLQDRQCAVKCDGPHADCNCGYCRLSAALASDAGRDFLAKLEAAEACAALLSKYFRGSLLTPDEMAKALAAWEAIP